MISLKIKNPEEYQRSWFSKLKKKLAESLPQTPSVDLSAEFQNAGKSHKKVKKSKNKNKKQKNRD